MKRRFKYVLCLTAALAIACPGMAQFQSLKEGQMAEWTVEPAFRNDVFTFARIKYRSSRGSRGWRGRGGWETDYPDAEWNLSYRLQQMTSLKVNPEGKILELTDPDLYQYPFIYFVEPGDLYLDDREVEALRNYLLNGGFMMADDFWGESAWDNFHYQMKRVFPDKEPEELPLEHPVFNIVFPLKEKPQVPNVDRGTRSQFDGVTWEQWDAQTPHYRAIHDDKGRMMGIFCHNTDLGDGWEREGYNIYYFKEFSEKSAYPLAINIIVYAMTH